MNWKKEITDILGKTAEFCAKHKHELYAGAGIGCWIVATVTACKSTVDAVKTVEEKKPESKKETVKECWKYYITPVSFAVLGTGLVIGSVHESNKRYLALGTAYKFAEETADIYRKKVIEKFGEKKEQEVQAEVAQARMDDNPPSQTNQVIVASNGNTWFYDSFSGRYFKFEVGKVQKVENDLNAVLLRENYVSLNDLYTRFGLEHIDIGYDIGWDSGQGLISIMQSAKIRPEDGEPCIVIDYRPFPSENYYKFYK